MESIEIGEPKPLKTVQKLLTILCLCSSEKGTSGWKKVAYIIITFVLVSTQLFVCIESVAFLFNFTPKDFEHFLFAAAITLSRLSMLYIIIIAIVSWEDIPTIFSSIDEIYDARKVLLCLNKKKLYKKHQFIQLVKGKKEKLFHLKYCICR